MESEFVAQSPVDSQQADTGAKEEAPQFVTNEQLQQFGDKLAGDMKAMFGRVPHLVEQQVEGLRRPEPAKQEQKEPSNIDPKAEVAKLLKAEREALEAERNNVNRQRIRSSIENALNDNGANPSAVKLATDSLMMRNQGKIEIASNELGETSVVYRESEFADPVGVGDFVKSFLSSQEGQSVIQQKKSPSLHSVPNGRGPVPGDVLKISKMEAAQRAASDPSFVKMLTSGKVVFED